MSHIDKWQQILQLIEQIDQLEESGLKPVRIKVGRDIWTTLAAAAATAGQTLADDITLQLHGVPLELDGAITSWKFILPEEDKEEIS